MKSQQFLTRTAMFLALTVSVQLFKFPPVITGLLVNLMLIISTALAGTAGGVFIGSMTPWVALIFGILPAPLFPAVPFIMAGNAAYCFLFGRLYRPNTTVWLSWAGVVGGSLVKFAIIGGGVKLVLDLPAPIVEVLFLPQLFNAFLGGGLGLLLATKVRNVTEKSSLSHEVSQDETGDGGELLP